MDKTRYTCNLTKDLVVWLAETAKRKDLSASAYLRKLLREKQEAENRQPAPSR
jgi:hypothetical protein